MEGETENKNQRNKRNKEKVRENLNSTNAKKYGKFNLKLAKRKKMQENQIRMHHMRENSK